MKNKLTEKDKKKYLKELSVLLNKAKFAQAYQLSQKLLKAYPHELAFSYYEAMLTAEDTSGLSAIEAKKRTKLAAGKLKKLLSRLNGQPLDFRSRVRNEYYWFSNQPYKQYLLGKEMVSKGRKGSYYSQGVGASRIARKFAEKGDKNRTQFWAKRSIEAWDEFFKISPNWSNAYFFYGRALGYLGRFDQMEAAFRKVQKITGRSPRWKIFTEIRTAVMNAHEGWTDKELSRK